ncbi:hypothetical protein [Oceanirhabdus sp. W0125-5]|uniref:hypothetical protein n=1 Tax=Oceanirhabdus sp. W0125-5 TaxID=2999116 RepID=UPI0022F2DE43|nr:hypothetical protein [Oceanirhabdus sp. W0125-5]WBW97673.1 hypothetical protein OW730_02525 [Oceanirhabdus sp. W0125-5]
MKKKEYERWSKIREKGKLKYFLIYILLGFALPAGICAEVFSRIFDKEFTLNVLYQTNFYGGIIGRVIVFVVIGWLIIGRSEWKRNEKAWNKEKNKLINTELD